MIILFAKFSRGLRLFKGVRLFQTLEYFITTVCIGEPSQQKLRPSINLSTNNNKALQLFAMRRCLLGESTIVPNREVCGLEIGEPAQQKLRSSINLSTNNSKALQLFAMR